MYETPPKMKEMFGGNPNGGFMDLPRCEPGDTRDDDIILLGAPAATPYTSVGNYCATAPDAVRAAEGWPGVPGHHDFDIDGVLLPDGDIGGRGALVASRLVAMVMALAARQR